MCDLSNPKNMNIPFSIRHKDLIEQKRFNVSFNINQRTKLLSLLNDYNETFSETTETNWHYYETAFEKVYKDLLRAYGYKKLKAFVGGEFVEVDNLEPFFESTKPELLLDTVEFLFSYIFEEESKQTFIKKLNNLLKIEESPVRFLEGEFFRLDSDFIESEILSKAEKLLKGNHFEKAHSDFLDAKSRLSKGDFFGCIVSANNSLESFLKKLLGENQGSQNSLKKKLMKTGIIPDYFQGFLDNFSGLMQSSFSIANKSSRHGQPELPSEKNIVDEPVASFCLNLVGTLIVFIAQKHINLQPPKENKENKSEKDDSNDLPF